MFPCSLRTFLRGRAEGLCFLLLSVTVAPLALACALLGLLRGNGAEVRKRLAHGIRRWGRMAAHGLEDIRAAWHINTRFEREVSLWHHVVLLELLAAANLADPPKAEAGAERYLVCKLAHFGDAMHIGPMLKALRAARPSARIDLLVGPWCEDYGRRLREVDQVVVYTPHYVLFNRGSRRGLRRGWREWAFLRRLHAARYDVVISTSTLNLPELLLIQAAAPAYWVGTGIGLLAWYPDPPARVETYDTGAYEADRVVGLLRHLGLDGAPAGLEYPVTADESAFAVATRQAATGNTARPLVVVAPGAGWPGKAWPADRYAKVVRHLVESVGACVALAGSPEEKALAGTVARLAGVPVLDLAGQTTLGQLAALLREANLFLGNDSGPMHLAAAAGIPMVVLFGPTVASKWAPKQRCTVLQKEHRCEGCWSWHPNARCAHDNACMKRIEVDEVIEAVRARLQEAAPRPERRGEPA